LSPRDDDPVKIVKKVNNNIYKVELSETYGISTTFNIVDLSPYLDDEACINSKANYVQLGEYDKKLRSIISLSIVTSLAY